MNNLDPLRFYTQILDVFPELEKIKSLAVRIQEYETAAQLREFEKCLLEAEQLASTVQFAFLSRFPLKTIAKRSLFDYARALQWRDLPESIIQGLIIRKNDLNSGWHFDETHVDFVKQLDHVLKLEEEHLVKLTRKLLRKAHQQNSFKEWVGYLRLELFQEEPDGNGLTAPYYQLLWSTADFISRFKRKANVYPVRASLPPPLKTKRFSVLFILLLEEGLLAWEDLVQVNFVRLKLPVYYVSAAASLSVD